MGKLSLNELIANKPSVKLIKTINSIKGGNESGCHPDTHDGPISTTTIIRGNGN